MGPDPRRTDAARLFAAGVSQAEVARRLGIARSTSCTWHRLWRAGALSTARISGRPARLTGTRLRSLGAVLLDPPRRHGFALDAWSLTAVAALIERRTGVRYHARHVTRLVRRMGWLVPPFGRSTSAAVYAVPLADPSGNALALLVRPNGGD